MIDADRIALTEGALSWIAAEVDAADDNEDADPWDVLDRIRARATDTLTSTREIG